MNIDWQKIYNDAAEWLLTFGPKILLALLIFFIGMFVIRLINKALNNTFEKKKLNQSVGYFLQNLLIVALKILLIVLCFQIIGIELTILSAIIAGFTVAAGLALSGTLQNFVNGILILLLKPFKVGDEIIIDDKNGKVTGIKLFYTEILTGDNITIIVPNGQLANNTVTNLSRQATRRIHIQLKFPYNTNISATKESIMHTIETTPNILTNPAPSVEVTSLDTDIFTVSAKLWVDVKHYSNTQIKLNEAFITHLQQAGIHFPERSNTA